jgi:glutamyl-tRNA reductase
MLIIIIIFKRSNVMSNSVNKSNTIKWIVSFLLPILVAFIPVSGEFTSPIKGFAIITVFAICLIATEVVPLFVVAVALPVTYIVFLKVDPKIAFAAWSIDVPWLILGGYILTIALEKVFQTAIRAAKQVKSQVPLVIADNSAALQAVALLRKKLSSLQDVPCMVIGNGQIGKLTATELLKHGAKVKMTLRKKIHGNEVKSSIIPPGCTMIPYENRVQELPTVEVVISATRSPHFTLKRDEVEGFLDNSMKPMIFIDLAVPRDIDPEISQCNQALVFDMDHLGIESYQESNRQSIGASIKILEEHLSELKQWFSFREMVSPIHEIIRAFEEDVFGRITNPVKHMQLKEEDKEQLMKAMEKVVGKSMGKILFGLKDTLREPLWQECLEAIHKSAMKDTIKY